MRAARAAAPALIATLALLAVAPSGARAGFCEGGVVYDYAQALHRMPPLRPIPSSRGLPFGQAPSQLPFGPRGVYLGRRGQSELMLSEGGEGLTPRVDEVGYALSIPVRGKFANPHLPPIDWLVTTKLARVNEAGTAGRSLDSITREVTGPGPREAVRLTVPFSGELGYYRLAISFRNGAGKRLARYGEYFRVLPPFSDTRFTLGASSYRPGEAVAGCLENYGTIPATHGVCGISIESHGYAGWQPAPFDPPRPCPALAQSLGAGMSIRVASITIPVDAPAGSYRARYEGLTADFQILPPS